MDKEGLPVLPKGWRKSKEYAGYKEAGAEKKEDNKFIPIEDIEIGAVYRTHVKDLVKVLDKDEKLQKFKLYNISGAFKQWTDFRNASFVEKMI